MKPTPTLVIGAWLLAFSLASVGADDTGSKVPKYVRIVQHEVREGKSQEFASLVRQMRDSLRDVNYHWIAATPITGISDRVDVIAFYDSYAQMEEMQRKAAKTLVSLQENPDFNRGLADALVGRRAVIAKFREDLSYQAERFDIVNATVWDFSLLSLKPGASMEFNDLEKESLEIHKRANIDESWVVYEVEYGVPTPAYIFLNPMKSLAELDKDYSEAHKAAFPDSVKRRFAAIAREAVITEESVLLMIRPELSRPPQTVVAANPTFWIMKAETSTATGKSTKKGKKGMEPASTAQGNSR